MLTCGNATCCRLNAGLQRSPGLNLCNQLMLAHVANDAFRHSVTKWRILKWRDFLNYPEKNPCESPYESELESTLTTDGGGEGFARKAKVSRVRERRTLAAGLEIRKKALIQEIQSCGGAEKAGTWFFSQSLSLEGGWHC